MSGDLILASASPRRSEILTRLGVTFFVQPFPAPELDHHPDGPAALVIENARRKALPVSAGEPQAGVIGCDTEVICDGRTLGKPADAAANCAMLTLLSGRTHEVYTSLVLARAASVRFAGYACTRVTFAPLSADTIAAYVNACRPFDKAGGYGLQELPSAFGVVLDGEYDTVVGFPTALFLRELPLAFPSTGG